MSSKKSMGFKRSIKKLLFSKPSVSQNELHLLSKEIYPIYVAFFLFAIMYSIKYVFFGFLWKRILFVFIFGIGTSKHWKKIYISDTKNNSQKKK